MKQAYRNHKENPEISVIVFLNSEDVCATEKCLCGLKKQSFYNFEVICLDTIQDNSVIGTVQKYVESDSRFMLAEHNSDLSIAEVYTMGLQSAKGEYCLFLNNSDFPERNLLYDNLKVMKKEQADVCLYDIRSAEEIVPYIFNMTDGALSGKFFRKTAISRTEVEFLTEQKGIDLNFIFMALALSKKTIFLSGKCLCRDLNSVSTRQNIFFDTSVFLLRELKRQLETIEMNQETKNAFANLSLYLLINGLFALEQADKFFETYYLLKDQLSSEMKLNNLSRDDVYPQNRQTYDIYMDIMKYDLKEYLFQSIRKMKKQKKKLLKAVETAEERVAQTKNCATYRIGCKFCPVSEKRLVLENNK